MKYQGTLAGADGSTIIAALDLNIVEGGHVVAVGGLTIVEPPAPAPKSEPVPIQQQPAQQQASAEQQQQQQQQ